jgi:glucose-6-phosphate-specific signal transduction histidine kinase
MNQPAEPGQSNGLAESRAMGRSGIPHSRPTALYWFAAAVVASLALGIASREWFASLLAAAGRPETLGALLCAAVGMATWMAPNADWAEPAEEIAPPHRKDLIREPAVRDRLGRGLVEASERRQQHFRQSLEIGLVRQLSGVSVLAGLLEQKLSAQDRPEAAEVARLRDLVEQTISEARVLAAAAHPPEIETGGLQAALLKMAEDAEKYRVYCRVVEDSFCQPDDAVSALQLYRVVQALVERAIRHGQAHHLLVELTAGPEKFMTMTVTDRVSDGDLLPQLSPSDLCDLRARVRSIGAALQVEHPAGALRLTCRMQAKGPKLQGSSAREKAQSSVL